MSRLDLSLTIVSFNKRDDLARCLRALPAALGSLSAEIIVVDNASGDGSADMVEAEFPEVRLVRQTAPTGSSANFNAGLRRSAATRVAVMHEDATARPYALERLARALDGESGIGCVAPRILTPEGMPESSTRHFPRLGWYAAMAAHGGLVQRLWPDRYKEERENAPFCPDWADATCLMFRREALVKSGLFDENFHIFFEETDLQRRLRDAGWRVRWVPEAAVTHVGGVTRSTAKSPIGHHWNRSRYLYFRTHRGVPAEASLRLAEAVSGAVKLVMLLVKSVASADARTRSGLAAQRDRLMIPLRCWPHRDERLSAPGFDA